MYNYVEKKSHVKMTIEHLCIASVKHGTPDNWFLFNPYKAIYPYKQNMNHNFSFLYMCGIVYSLLCTNSNESGFCQIFVFGTYFLKFSFFDNNSVHSMNIIHPYIMFLCTSNEGWFT